MSNVNVQIKFRNESYRELTQYQSAGAAGFDLRANLEEDLVLQPGQCELVDSGLSVFIDNPEYAGFILPRSGLGHKHGIILGNGTGLIDSDYQGKLMISVWNRSNQEFTIKPDERIAQYVVQPVLQVGFIEVPVDQEFTVEHSGARGENGFGSSGTK